MKNLKLIVILGLTLCSPLLACTIFVLTDADRALFCNNEDWEESNTRIWFVPAGEGHFGCAHVGFDNGWTQGGLNTAGLAFDWVAGPRKPGVTNPDLRPVAGNPAQRMLETCATVDEAAEFFRSYREPSFSYAWILVADRSGVSAVIGLKDGQVNVERSDRCRGFGYGREILQKRLEGNPEPTVRNATAILRECRQPGRYATKYSNVFDLKSGDIHLVQPGESPWEMQLNLDRELEKGGHYYDIPRLPRQFAQPVMPLSDNMRHVFVGDLKPIRDEEPKVTERLRGLLVVAGQGKMRSRDYGDELWAALEREANTIKRDLGMLGQLREMVLVERRGQGDQRHYRYRVDYEHATLLQHYILNRKGRVISTKTEDLRWGF